MRASVAGPTGTLTVAVVTLGTSGNTTGAIAATPGSVSEPGGGTAGFADGLLAVWTTGTGGFSRGIKGSCAVWATGAAFMRARSTAWRWGQSTVGNAIAVAANDSTRGISVG